MREVIGRRSQPLIEVIDLASVPERADTVLDEFLSAKARAAADEYVPAEVCGILRDFLLAGGKRLRPMLCVAGWQAAGSHSETELVLRLGASLEMFHAFCLIHDDVMDNSATRSGQPTVHRVKVRRHTVGRSLTGADRLETGAAILLGYLALACADELLHFSVLGPSQLGAILPLIEARAEAVYGQYLDLAAAGIPTGDLDRALKVIRYKTAKYTCERPLQIGAALAGADLQLRERLSAFGVPLGQAFQLRDDLLGVFGVPDETGKPTFDDLREGHTALVALTLQRATLDQVAQLRRLIGHRSLTEDQAPGVREITTVTGARDAVKAMIRTLHEKALRALETLQLGSDTAAALRRPADRAVRRLAGSPPTGATIWSATCFTPPARRHVGGTLEPTGAMRADPSAMTRGNGIPARSPPEPSRRTSWVTSRQGTRASARMERRRVPRGLPSLRRGEWKVQEAYSGAGDQATSRTATCNDTNLKIVLNNPPALQYAKGVHDLAAG
ncbi:polyprenyl synthetase family protein [Streptomyces sp. NRRL B-1347]|uniref:polyprenyl synthetase family protein n=1 Tax=Streptomyces sp. NRRL B-1347 TaxID=1476877 RepID=UPI00099D5DFD|nr:polyprenyl synthetase family protein [Streptomyces sp. NRRL B-1347]